MKDICRARDKSDTVLCICLTKLPSDYIEVELRKYPHYWTD